MDTWIMRIEEIATKVGFPFCARVVSVNCGQVSSLDRVIWAELPNGWYLQQDNISGKLFEMIVPQQGKHHYWSLLYAISPEISSLSNRARVYATYFHQGAKRSNDEPYINHPSRVVANLLSIGILDEEILAAAWLHDVPEDCSNQINTCENHFESIWKNFGEKTSTIVKQLTNIVPPGSSFEQKQASLLDHAKAMGDSAKLVKLADRLDNLRGMETWDKHRKTRYALAGLDLLKCLYPIPERGASLAQKINETAESIISLNG